MSSLSKDRNSNAKELMISYAVPSLSWEIIATDLFHCSNTDYIVVINLYSRYLTT